MSVILIRTMQPEDAPKVNDLAAQLGYPAPVAATSERIALLLQQENDQLLVAVEGPEVVGWIHVYKTLWLESGAFAEIAALVVDEQHRGKGVESNWWKLQKTGASVTIARCLKSGAMCFVPGRTGSTSI